MKGPASILIEICGDGVRNPPGQQITSWTSPRCESYGHALWGVSGLSPWLWRVLWACWQRSISSASFWFCWSFSGSLPTSSCLGSTWSMPLSLSQGWRGKILTNSVIKIFGSAGWLSTVHECPGSCLEYWQGKILQIHDIGVYEEISNIDDYGTKIYFDLQDLRSLNHCSMLS